MFVKICANTNLADAMLSADAGADAVGFVFAKSSRQVTAAQVAGITHALPASIKKIGVFHARTAEEIIHDVHIAGLNGVQLHFAFDREVIAKLRAEFGNDLFIVQTLHWVRACGAGGEVVSRVAADGGAKLAPARRRGRHPDRRAHRSGQRRHGREL